MSSTTTTYLGVKHGHQQLDEFLHGEPPLSVLLEVQHEESQVWLLQQGCGLLLDHLLDQGNLLLGGGGGRRARDEAQPPPANIKAGRVGQDRHGLVMLSLPSHLSQRLTRISQRNFKRLTVNCGW